MSNNIDFDKYYLSIFAKIVLFFLLFKKKFRLKHFPHTKERLLNYKLIKPNYSSQKDRIGCSIPDGTYSKTELFSEYRIYTHMQLFRSFVFPIIISVITTLIVNLLKLPIRILNRNPYEYSVFTSKK